MIGLIVLIAFIGPVQVSGRSVAQTSCEYKDISQKYSKSCERTYVEDIFKNVLNDEIVRGNELLQQLSTTCSNFETYKKCVNCTARHVCPEERTKFSELLSERWALFCEADQPSNWIRTILQNGYSYNKSCDFVFGSTFMSCFHDSPGDNATSLTDVSEGYRSVMTAIFKCTVGEILSSSEEIRYCGSSWQDILLTNWLKISTEHGIGLRIGEDEVKQLQMMRC
ncbi:uncharacterized protein LOC123534545 isoform X1 [Mercenaria mercenaria]|uniref:uncharacterized protein LOC123534545 isoform X1 n=1 Tax=Mercenaria mercenaria TaxID=6596 RepID=UPI00234F836F|nr:uncharacterized protein LOC123534545 isoform X1 [Mercenaria mercenaria]